MHHEPLLNNPLRSKDDLRRALQDLWAPLRPHFVKAGAHAFWGDASGHYSRLGAKMECFARPLWGLAPLAAGGGQFADWPLYHAGLADGVNPASPRYWGDTQDRDQRFVEMAAIALGLLLARDKLWEPLDPQTRARACAWLQRINHHILPETNWLFFRVFVNLALRAAGHDQDNSRQIEADLAQIDAFYRGDGWYTDGPNTRRDYYVPMAFHYWGLVYSALFGREDPARAETYRERARVFAQDYLHWFANGGEALPFGRSLLYRMCQCDFWGALAYAKVEALPWGVIKGLHLRNLRWWFRQPVFSETGLLTIGYRYPNLIVSESYNAPGSPYWALKAFLPLALPEDHPYWRATELPRPEQALSVQPRVSMIVCHDRARDHVLALSASERPTNGRRNMGQKYAKFAYSTVFGFNCSSSNDVPPYETAESMLLLSDDGHDWRWHETHTEESVGARGIHFAWRPFPGVKVNTWLLPALPGHVRVHRLESDRALEALEGGFALPCEAPEEVRAGGSGGEVIARSASHIVGLKALDAGAVGEVVKLLPNTNVLHPMTELPLLRRRLPPGTTWLITLAAGFPGLAGQAELEAWLASFAADFGPRHPAITQGGRLLFSKAEAPVNNAAPLPASE